LLSSAVIATKVRDKEDKEDKGDKGDKGIWEYGKNVDC
jgi:hypothetical protein